MSIDLLQQHSKNSRGISNVRIVKYPCLMPRKGLLVSSSTCLADAPRKRSSRCASALHEINGEMLTPEFEQKYNEKISAIDMNELAQEIKLSGRTALMCVEKFAIATGKQKINCPGAS